MAMLIAVTVGVLAGTWLAEYAGDSAYGKVRSSTTCCCPPVDLIGLFIYQIWSSRCTASPGSPGPSPWPSWRRR